MIRAPFALDGVNFIALPHQDEIDFSAVNVALNFRLAARVDEPVAMIFRWGKRSAPIFRTMLGSGN